MQLTAFFTDPPSWAAIAGLTAVGALLLIALTALIVNMPPKEKPVSLLAKLAPYTKAIVAAVIGAATVIAKQRGVDLNVWLERALAFLAAGGFVYTVPNKTPAP